MCFKLPTYKSPLQLKNSVRAEKNPPVLLPWPVILVSGHFESCNVFFLSLTIPIRKTSSTFDNFRALFSFMVQHKIKSCGYA